MDKDSTNKFEEQLKSHAEKMRDIYEHCESEEQTKTSMINPFIELLDYDVRDPRVVALEYPVFTTSGERGSIKADYALFCSEEERTKKMPRILIEAKAASNDLAHANLLRQISEYANLQTSVEFVALTNGHLWNWYRKERTLDGRNLQLSQEPFLSHNLLEPRTRNPRELRFLKQISSKSFTLDAVQEAADEVRFSEGTLKFLEGIIDSPPEEIRRLLFKRWGISKNRRDVALFEQVWPECIEMFIESQARKMQLDELLQEVKGNQQGESQTGEIEQGSEEQETRADRSHSFNTRRGKVSIDPRTTIKRAWKPSQSENWTVESNGRIVLISVIKYLSTLDSRGPKHFLEECAQKSTIIKHDSEFNEGTSKKNWRECNEGYLVFTNLSNVYKTDHIKRISKFVHNSEDRDENGDLVHLWLPDLDPKT